MDAGNGGTRGWCTGSPGQVDAGYACHVTSFAILRTKTHRTMKVPPHATAHIFVSSGANETEHILVRDGHVLHILVPKWIVFDRSKSENEVEDNRVNYVIEPIETLINTIDFSQTLTAFLVRRRNGDTLVPTPLPSALLARLGSASSMRAKSKLLTGYMCSIGKGDGMTWTLNSGLVTKIEDE
ncbi:hypothetical protein EDD85DRAFT_1008525 [Armillaria nabsnona]|nr:hypothetical protein EDD85DRAFT_1008525 [Armillaria nabsnona]